MGTEPDDQAPSGDDLEYLETWDAAAEEAMATVQAALPDERGLEPPTTELRAAASALREGFHARRDTHRTILRANGWDPDELPTDDEVLVLWSAGALLVVEEDPGLDPDDHAALESLQFGDWVGAVIGLVRAGPGSSASPGTILSHIDACPDVEGTIPRDDRPLVATAFTLLSPSWRTSGLVDDRTRLTRLGAWALPRLLAVAWNVPFDG